MNDEEHKKKENKRYLKKKGGFKIESTDPVQDIMTDDELKDAERRIKSLLDGENNN